MKREPEAIVADIVAATGGSLVSRIRLQKIAYLLDKLGADSGFSFTYHHFGPYSRDLDSAILDAELFQGVTETYKYRESDGARYSVFKVQNAQDREFTYLAKKELRDRAQDLAKQAVTVLELAATANWLLKEERVADWKREIERRKGPKLRNGRLKEAIDLLASLKLQPASL